MMYRFVCFRNNPPEDYQRAGRGNAPDERQFEGVVFSDGTVCVRWLTKCRSHSIWLSLGDLLAIHGHPEYDTKLSWLDGVPPDWYRVPEQARPALDLEGE